MKRHSGLTRSTQIVNEQTRKLDLFSETATQRDDRILWIDGVGGFLLLDQDEVLLGQAVPGTKVDIAIVGDLSRQAAAIRRSEGDYVLQPLQAMKLNDRFVDRPQVVTDGSILQLGERVQMAFRKPNPLSSTARLDMRSVHRFKPNVDGVLLLADSCVIGPTPGSHVVCPSWSSELLLFRHADQWCFRTLVEVEVNGESQIGQIPLVAGQRIQGESFSLSVE